MIIRRKLTHQWRHVLPVHSAWSCHNHPHELDSSVLYYYILFYWVHVYVWLQHPQGPTGLADEGLCFYKTNNLDVKYLLTFVIVFYAKFVLLKSNTKTWNELPLNISETFIFTFPQTFHDEIAIFEPLIDSQDCAQYHWVRSE